MTALSWFTTWIVMILLMIVMAKTEWGKTIVYYTLWLAVFLLLVTHGDTLSSLVNPKALELNG